MVQLGQAEWGWSEIEGGLGLRPKRGGVAAYRIP